MIKRIIIRLLIALVIIVGVIFFGLHTMDIEDRYGDLQDLYWQSKDGDFIFNRVNSKIGIIELNKSRIYIREKDSLIEVETWLDPYDKRRFQASVYRSIGFRDKQRSKSDIDLNSKYRLITTVDVHY